MQNRQTLGFTPTSPALPFLRGRSAGSAEAQCPPPWHRTAKGPLGCTALLLSRQHLRRRAAAAGLARSCTERESKAGRGGCWTRRFTAPRCSPTRPPARSRLCPPPGAGQTAAGDRAANVRKCREERKGERGEEITKPNQQTSNHHRQKPPAYSGQIRFTFRCRRDAITLPSVGTGSP